MDRSTLKQILGIDETEQRSTVTIGVASPDVIRSWSRGEVKNPETINYRSFKPEKGGLFCERIFGPTRDWECSCGKYKRIKHKGVVCDRCGVEVTQSRVRRERMGHIELAVPVSHVWFFKCMPSRMGLMLDMTARAMERVVYYEDWIVIDGGDTPLEPKTILTDDEYREARENYGDAFEAGMGAEAMQQLLQRIDLKALREELTAEMGTTRSKATRKKLAKRLRLVEGFAENEMDPGWMVLTVLPVIPPDLRPLVPLEGGRFATSDLNDLYRRVINRNNRLKNLLQLRTPGVIIRNEKRMLQEAVDALLDNGRHGRAVTGTGNRALKSLSDMLKGKQGRFRQNLLGKRVDYSGRSVIVVGPQLRIHQCGLPKEMAMTLFEPFIMRRLKERGYVHTVRSAKKMIERRVPVVWDILDEVIQGHPIMLNRAPTLHRLSIQAFDPILVEGKAIQLHPLVCAAYNADFDGDQMAVHVPLCNEAQMEARLLMLAPNNIFSPASGKPLATPSQDITLGAYYLTNTRHQNGEPEKKPDSSKVYSSYTEVVRALEQGCVHIHDAILVRNPDRGRQTPWGNADARLLETTPGRCIFNQIWPDEMGFWNNEAGKKALGTMIGQCYETVGRERTTRLLDDLKDLGYDYATKAGFSIGIADMIIPDVKSKRIAQAQKEIAEIRKQREQGVITERERYNKMIDVWSQTNSDIAGKLFEVLEDNRKSREINPVFAMLDSGARGSKDQIRQLAGMRGLMAKPSGEIIERPILSNFREGLTVLEYFISSHGARKGLADTALKTADSGYMTRKLVDVAQDVICVERDCGTVNGIWVRPIREGDEETVPLRDRLIGRYSSDDIHDPLATGEDDALLVAGGEEITPDIADAIVDRGIEEVHIRSVLTCESRRGVCAHCYGRNLATGELPQDGEALGIIAAQSIGEPGTQLTMRTFHVGGTAAASAKQPVLKARSNGYVRLEEARYVEQEDGKWVILSKDGAAVIENKDGVEIERHQLVAGTVLTHREGEKVEAGEVFGQWDPYNVPIITRTSGRIEYRDLIEGVTLRRELSQASSREEVTVMEHREDLHPQLVILNDKGEIADHYSLPGGAHIMVEEGHEVLAGQTVARTPRQTIRTKDITVGLPRVAELFEARRPKDAAEIARIDGVIELGNVSRGRRTVTIRDLENNEAEEHVVPVAKRITVFDGDFVRKGQPITDGAVVPHELLEVCGPQELQTYLVNEVQQVYRLQGVEINDKHIEIVVRQMMRKVRITDPGSSSFLYGESVDRSRFLEVNARVVAEGGQPAEAQPILLGITKASLETDSFISAASFQDTTRVLTESATFGRVDSLRGFKENVIMGQLIPAGTGYEDCRAFSLEKTISESEVPELSETEEDQAGSEDRSAEARRVLDL